jgi:ClpP class serine protease
MRKILILTVMSLTSILSFASKGEAFMRTEPGNQYHQLARDFVEGKISEDSPVMATLKAGLAQSSPYIIDAPGVVYKLNDTDQSAADLFNSAPANSVAVIPLLGPMSKEDWCGYPGMITLSDWIVKAKNAPNICALVLYGDCPGSTVFGVFEFAATVIEANKVKPVLTYTDGELCSGGYLIGSCAREIYASSNSPLIGCIGTAISIYDSSAYNKKAGFVTHVINADQSPNKNREGLDARKGDYKAIRAQILNPMCIDFQNHVVAQRGKKLKLGEDNQPINGYVYTAGVALENGLIDGIKPFADVVARARQLGTSSTIKIG